jgi:hypothetical protein
MTRSKLNELTVRQKADMGYVAKAWARSGQTTRVLEDGLRVLASDKRPTADEIARREDPFTAVTCKYGKGYRDKLTLSKEDAAIMLEAVVQLRKEAHDEKGAKKIINLAAGVLFDGIPVPKTITDPSWEPVLRLIRETAPSLGQSLMF